MYIILVSRVTMVKMEELETMVTLEHQYVLLYYYNPAGKNACPQIRFVVSLYLPDHWYLTYQNNQSFVF
jgi:hypothetical protein